MIAAIEHHDPGLKNPLPIYASDIGHGMCVHRTPWPEWATWHVTDCATGLTISQSFSRREAVHRAWLILRRNMRNHGVHAPDAMLAYARTKYERQLVDYHA